ncbi:MAG: YggS family pyridoxal phosphate-dependent enzyme [Saprospiraceae bacterium]|nr:YggS family pyridoxal phosphate-dependent enzyme [Saprospiraceae bacterium]
MPDINTYKSIAEKLLEQKVCLVAVSKTKPQEDILVLYQEGQRVFGENRVQELVEKQAALPKDIQWHAIGHLQRNKIKYIAPFISLIHSVDSLRLLEEINKQAQKHDRIIDCLLQFHIATEESKFGLSIEEAQSLLKSDAYQSMQNVRICGVMGMASFVSDQVQIQQEFKTLKSYFDSLQTEFFSQEPAFKECSMGMSGDYELAIQEGSTMVRVGSLLFGHR